ncbi:phage tail protein [Breoghania sp.]|uniref:phage tail protein n=1 Tax=Breoghania sp. TaxID=2065378 RepID=UPI002AA6F20A|nr:phage tail protein [Breoghania sp.]
MVGLVKVDWRLAKAERLFSSLSDKRMAQALSTGVNKTARGTMTFAAGLVAKEMGARRKDTKKSFRIYPYSKPDTLSATVRGRGKRLPLMTFKARRGKKGASAAAWGKRKTYAGTFIATMASGHAGVFKRDGKSRFPISELWGPGVASTMEQEAVESVIVDQGRDRLLANVEYQIARYMRR